MKIGILGGSFNPAHLGHINLSNLALQKLKLDQIWWIPTAFNPFKNIEIYSSLDQRISECKKLTANHPKIYVKKFSEIYTVNLIERLQNKHCDNNFFWIMGADNIKNFHLWKNFAKLIRLLPIAIFSRQNHLKNIYKSPAWQIYQNIKLNYSARDLAISNVDDLSKISKYYKKNMINSSCHKQFLLPLRSNYSLNSSRFNSQNIRDPISSGVYNAKGYNQNILPKIFIFRTKNFDISSSQIRNNNIK